jgi:flagellar basal-body rod modification protein FlgD
MNVTATLPIRQQASYGSDTVNPTGSLDYDAFLRLLIAQMKNQDPTKPTDPAQFVAQLASFSSVEQAIKTNNKLDALMTAMAMSQAEGLTITGTVTGVRVISGGAVAILEDGRQVLLGPGVTVS